MKFNLLVVFGAVLVIAMVAGVSITAERTSGPTPTFNKDVAPILFNNCVNCHRPNQTAPMSFLSYKDVRPWARAIKDKVTTGQMPPWYADPRYGTFRNDRRLTADQISTLVAWADAGAPQGDTALALQVPTFAEGWSHPSGRPPDFVVEMANEFNVPAEGELPNFTIYQPLPAELQKEDHFLEAIQILPGTISVMHHASFGIQPLRPETKIGTGEVWPGGPVFDGVLIDVKTGKPVGRLGDVNEAGAVEVAAARSRAEAASQTAGTRFCCYVPGGSFQQFAPGAGKRIPHDGIISWGLHYTPQGKAIADRTRVGLWYQKGEMTHEIVESGSGETHIILGKEQIDDKATPVINGVVGNSGVPAKPVIPPNTDNWAITGIRVFKDDVTLYTMWPHMHTRGREMTFLLTYPDGREQVLLNVPRYDFNWQIFYELKEPIKIPAGSTLKNIGSYNNSATNRLNPAPHKEVYWSEQSWDEMYLGFADISLDKMDLRLKKTPAKPQTAGVR